MTPTAVITGGTKGLGRATAEIFAQNGFDVFVCARTASDLTNMRAKWSHQFPQRMLWTFPADLSKKDDVVQFADFVLRHTSHVHVLVNNAGIFMPGAVADSPSGTLETLMEVNLFSAYHLTRRLLPGMVSRRSGHIFNMCSVASLIAYPHGGLYTISKFALLGFSKALRQELKDKGIRVTSVMPGATWSDSWSGVDFPPDRLMQASDVAKTIWAAYSLSDVAVLEEVVLRPQLGDV